MKNQLTFTDHLEALLPPDLPNREACITGSARHLELVVEVNQQYNLTRILDPREAAIKHIVDSVEPWRLFASARHIADAGSGAGFPGIPLALVFPDIQFSLLESTGRPDHLGSVHLRKTAPDQREQPKLLVHVLLGRDRHAIKEPS